MKITPYLKRTQSFESPIYIRLRDTNNGSDNQSIISVGFSVEPKYFKNGLVTTRHSDYLLINEEINRIISELNRIYIEFKTQGSIPLPNLIKKTYLDGLKQKRFDTEKIGILWGMTFSDIFKDRLIYSVYYSEKKSFVIQFH